MHKKRYFIQLAYNGTLYHGWQTQPNAIAVQEVLDKAMSICFRQPIATLGCGRTDAGVHASDFYAHFDVLDLEEERVLNSLDSINALLPYQIAAKNLILVEETAHARFDATSRTYQYFIHFSKDPFKLDSSWLLKDRLDIEQMNLAAAELLKHEDFSCFSKSNTQTFTNNCNIKLAGFEELPDKSLVFTVTADRFLRNMVRAIVGTLVLVGKGKLDAGDLKKIIESKNRSNAGQSVPACGLFLTKVEYPYLGQSNEKTTKKEQA
ncbi:tRNA pseudouridine38-40 synthase [Pedobacter sp. UYP30]|uniref:tRNA pseudouridine(38-40) synthase TruA n=1 Tax=Pedobacter sp. UYP30 TaxID=1756400 RepID=UPI00339580B9